MKSIRQWLDACPPIPDALLMLGNGEIEIGEAIFKMKHEDMAKVDWGTLSRMLTPPRKIKVCAVTDFEGNHCPNEPHFCLEFIDKEMWLCKPCYEAMRAGAYGHELVDATEEDEGTSQETIQGDG